MVTCMHCNDPISKAVDTVTKENFNDINFKRHGSELLPDSVENNVNLQSIFVNAVVKSV